MLPTAWEHPLISACVRKTRKPQNLQKVRKRHRFQIMAIILLVTVTLFTVALVIFLAGDHRHEFRGPFDKGHADFMLCLYVGDT